MRTRTVSPVSLRTPWAPSGPRGKRATSQGARTSEPSGSRNVGVPPSTRHPPPPPARVVVRADRLARRDLVDADPGLLRAQQLAEPRDAGAEAIRILAVVLERGRRDVDPPHVPTLATAANSKD